MQASKPSQFIPLQTVRSQPKNDRHEQIIEHLTRCCLCGNELKYHHETDYIMLTVREEAHCQSCGVRMRKESYTIQ